MLSPATMTGVAALVRPRVIRDSLPTIVMVREFLIAYSQFVAQKAPQHVQKIEAQKFVRDQLHILFSRKAQCTRRKTDEDIPKRFIAVLNVVSHHRQFFEWIKAVVDIPRSGWMDEWPMSEGIIASIPKRNGRGTVGTYSGGWTLFYSDGTVVDGFFCEGRCIDGQYRGNVLTTFGRPHFIVVQGKVDPQTNVVRGVMTDGVGNDLKGSFRGVSMVGEGERHFSDGVVARGNFENGRLNGWGVVRYSDGRTCESQFRDTVVDFSRLSADDLRRKLGEPMFAVALSSLASSTPKGYMIPLLAAHLEQAMGTRYQSIVDALTVSGEVALLDPKSACDRVMGLLQMSPDLNSNPHSSPYVLLSYGCNRHAMLLKLTAKPAGLYVDLFNAGEGVSEFHDRSPLNPNKFRASATYFLPGINYHGHILVDLMKRLLHYDRLESVEAAYGVFSKFGFINIQSDSPYQSVQKKGICVLKSILSFIKTEIQNHNAFVEYRIRLIEDTHREVAQSDHPDWKVVSPNISRARVLDRLDEMLMKRTVNSLVQIDLQGVDALASAGRSAR